MPGEGGEFGTVGADCPGFTLRVCTHLMLSSESRTGKAGDDMYRASHGASDGPETAQGDVMAALTTAKPLVSVPFALSLAKCN